MKIPSSATAFSSSILRLAIVLLAAVASIGLDFTVAPALRAETPPDQIKAAGAIPLTKELFNKMETFVKSVDSDAAAKTELAAASKDPTITPDNWGSTITSKCPKVAKIFETTGLTPDEFGKAIFAIMAVAMSEELAKSEDKAVKANADFVEANKEQANKIFGSFMMLGDSSSEPPAATP
jgi:hypothetical protein